MTSGKKKCTEHIQLNFSITLDERVMYKVSSVVFSVNLEKDNWMKTILKSKTHNKQGSSTKPEEPHKINSAKYNLKVASDLMRTELHQQQQQIFAGYWASTLKKPFALPLQMELSPWN